MTLLPFDWQSGPGPVHQRLAASLRTAITGGRLNPGDRLPPSRALADDLGVSRWVVTEAYEQLKAEGYLRSRTGSGTTVAATHRRTPDPAPAAPAAAPSRPVAAEVDLSPNLPDLRSFPRARWTAALRAAVGTIASRDLGYPDPLGDLELRRVLSEYLRRVRGVDADPSDVVVTSGTAHSLSILFRGLAADGRLRLGVEDPCWPRLLQTAVRAGLRTVAVPLDERGLRTAELDRLDLDAVCVTPAHQFPTGVVLAPERREQLLDWAGTDRLVIEDDYDAEFRYGRHPATALAALAGDEVAYLGSTSKTLVPGLRIGWMVLQGSRRAVVARVLGDDRTGPSTLEQRALALLIDGGGYDRHLRTMRRDYQQRRAGLVAALADAAPHGRIRGVDAGVHLLLEVDEVDEDLLVRALARRRLNVTALSDFRVESSGGAGVLIGYGNLPRHRLSSVAEAVADALAEQSPPMAPTVTG